jgi:DNA-binding MarR family transcriptional regulator
MTAIDTETERYKKEQALKAATAAGAETPLAWALRQTQLTYGEYRVLLALAQRASRLEWSTVMPSDEIRDLSGVKRPKKQLKRLLAKGLIRERHANDWGTIRYELINDRTPRT